MSNSEPSYLTVEDCFIDIGQTAVYHTKFAGDIKIQPASEVPEACDRCWQVLTPMMESEKRKIGDSASARDVLTNLAPNYRPQMVHFFSLSDGKAAVTWRVPFVPERPFLKSLLVALMMRNGVADPSHKWQMLGRGVSPNSLDIFLWGILSDEEKACMERGEYPESLKIVGQPPAGL